jgi:hypothetical protein
MVKRFVPNSRWVRYREGRWIPTRKRVFLYWFKFLQQAEKSDDYQVDWSKYRGWGGSKVVLSTRFDDWWEERWRYLFSIENPLDKPRFDISTERPKTDAYRIRLNVYEIRHLSNGEIGQKVQGIFEGQETHEMHSRVGRHLVASRNHLDNVCIGVFP